MVVPDRHVQKIDYLASLFRIADLKSFRISTGQKVAKLDFGHQGVEEIVHVSNTARKLKEFVLQHDAFPLLLWVQISELDVEDVNSTRIWTWIGREFFDCQEFKHEKEKINENGRAAGIHGHADTLNFECAASRYIKIIQQIR